MTDASSRMDLRFDVSLKGPEGRKKGDGGASEGKPEVSEMSEVAEG